MYDDYVIEWDLAFAEYLKKLASIFLKETPDLWPNIVSRLASDPASFEDDEDDDYGMVEVLDCSGGDLDNRALLQAFTHVLKALLKKLITRVRVKKVCSPLLRPIVIMT